MSKSVKYSDLVGNDAITTRSLRSKNEDDGEVYFRPILLTNTVPTLSYDYWTPSFNYQAIAKAVRVPFHHELYESNLFKMKRFIPVLDCEPIYPLSYYERKREIHESMNLDLLKSSRSSPHDDSYTMEELKDFLHQLGLKISGNKEELVRRILNDRYDIIDEVD